jgi:Leucine-rich repeat (LRR) protein
MGPKKGKGKVIEELPKVPRDLYEIAPLDGRDGVLGVEALEVSERVREALVEQVEQRIGIAIANGELDLDLKDCGLSEIPDALFGLQWLQVLDLSRNYLVPGVFSDLKDLAGLRAINLSGNLLALTLPASFGDLPQAIEEISIDDNNVEALPIEASNLSSLSWFSARRNLLREIPGQVLGAWSNLTYLDLRQNKLVTLPPEIGACTSLLELYLNDNALVELPSELGHCGKLEVLSVQRNKLTSVPLSLGGCISLQTLDFTGNVLTEIPIGMLGHLSNLRHLFLGTNKLQTLPSDIGLCLSLEQLSAPSNQLKILPDEIGNLSKLIEINCGNNPIVTLPPGVIGWVSMQSGIFRNCKLKALPAGVEAAWKAALLLDVRAKGKKDTCKAVDTIKSELKFTRIVGVIWSKPKPVKGKK